MAARICLKIGVVVSFASLAKIPVFTASDEVDCRAAVKSGYVSGDPVPHTCTAQLPLKDTETEIINSVRDEYQDYPVRCRYGKQTTISFEYFTNLLMSMASVLCLFVYLFFNAAMTVIQEQKRTTLVPCNMRWNNKAQRRTYCCPSGGSSLSRKYAHRERTEM